MRARILCTTAMLVLPVATWAQDGLRSASLPERSLTSAVSPARGDLFLAGPETYARRTDRHDTHGPFLGHVPVYWYRSDVVMEAGRQGPPYGNEGDRQGPPYGHEGRRPAEAMPRRPQRDVGSAPPRRPDASGRTPPPAERPPAAAPGIPRPFYVIAGCYAGDAPPRPDRLPPDCDPSKVRVMWP